MPFAPHVRVSALGRLGAIGGERFSYSVNITTASAGTFPDLFGAGQREIWQDVANSVKDFHGSPDAKISGDAVLDTVKIVRIIPPPAGYTVKPGQELPHGIYDGNPQIFEFNQPGGVAGQAGQNPQDALAVSLVTARRGPTGKGRFYIPLPVVMGLAANGWLIAESDVNTIRARAATMLSDINNAPGYDSGGAPTVVVASTKGYNTPVTGVRVGRVMDTIRSRRRQLSESYGPTSNF